MGAHVHARNQAAQVAVSFAGFHKDRQAQPGSPWFSPYIPVGGRDLYMSPRQPRGGHFNDHEFGLRFETADEVEAEEEEENAPAAGPSLVVADGTTKIIPEKPRKSTPAPEAETRSEEDAEAAPGDAKVISIDAFRKKT